MQQWIFIEAHDVWMFRDSKPFTAGESFFARSMFPPQPGTVQGMIRTHYYENTGQIIGSATDLGDLRVLGAFVAHKRGDVVRRYYPLPLDVLAGNPVRQLAPSRAFDFVTDLPKEWHPLVNREKVETPGKPDEGEFWLDETGFEQYRAGKSISAVVSETELYCFEERTGLALDYSRRAYRRRRDGAAEGLFYRAAFVRPNSGVGLLVGVEYPEPIFTENQGAIAIGGESRMGQYTVVEYDPRSPKVQSGRIKLILLTPAYFSAGWEAEVGWSRWLGNDARLISAAIGKPRAFSGWDMQHNRPKNLRHFVPAGSVYYFENARLPTEPFTETPTGEADYRAIGYGAFAATAWDYV